MLYNLMDGLMRNNNGKIEPGVATDYDVSSDGLTYTFHLRDDAMWSDGVQVKAGDFVYGLQRLMDPATAASGAYMSDNILEVKNLSFSFRTYGGTVKAVRDVSFRLRRGEILGIVGESGCGKSVATQCIVKLNPEPPGFFEGGSILYNGEDLLKKSDKQLRKIRGRRIGYIFQDPMTSLNPTMDEGRLVGTAIAESLGYLGKDEAQSAKDEIRKRLVALRQGPFGERRLKAKEAIMQKGAVR